LYCGSNFNMAASSSSNTPHPTSPLAAPMIVAAGARVAGLTIAWSGVGALTGVALATLRRHPKRLYGLRMGANFGILSGTFFSVREVCNWLDPNAPIGNSSIAGFVSGGALGTLFGT
jgi:hypothetical protein